MGEDHPYVFWLVFDVLRPQVFGSDVALVGLVVPKPSESRLPGCCCWVL